MANVIGIDHLSIRVSDLERSRAFYVIRIMARARWPEA